MVLATEGSSSSVTMKTPEKRPSRATTDTGTKRTVGRSRRRRPTSNPSSFSNDKAVIIDESDGKENYPGHRSRRRANAAAKTTAATTPVRRRGETNPNYIHDEDEEEEQCGSFQRKTTMRQNRERHCGEMAKFCESACRDFEKSLPRTSVTSSLWSDFPNLAHTLIKISFSKSSTIDSLGLGGHVSALLNLSRKLIKDASVQAGGDNDEKGQKKNKLSSKDNLFVAVHILRSVAFVFSEEATIERKEALLKMFFHLVTTSTRSGKGRNKDEDRFKSIALAGYEGLAKVLSNYFIQQQSRGDGKDQIVSFTRVQNERDSIHNRSQRILFVIPSTMRRKKQSSNLSSYKAGSMTTRQLCTIAFQTTMAVVKAILSLKDGSSLPYGNLGIALSAEFDNGGENSISHWHQIASALLQQVHIPWVMFFASDDINQREIAKEILSYTKGFHRLLWDAASTLKSSSNSSTKNIRRVERDCLELRKQAILRLLATTGISKLDLLIRKASFESGCTYAWKAASVFSQHLSPESDDTDKFLLANFYEDLDAAFSTLTDLDPIVPLGFVEYRMYKSLHLELISSFIEVTPDFDRIDDIKEGEVSNGNYRILLQIVSVGISSKMRINSYLNKNCQHRSLTEINESATPFTSMSVLERMINEFNWQVILRMDEIPNDSMNRILKALCNIALHKTLFLALKHIDQDKATSLSVSNQLETDLLVVATILSEYIGPLISAYLNHNPQKVSQLSDLMMECFLRPLSLYEQLYLASCDSEDGGRSYLEMSMNLSKYITEILTDDSMRPDDFVLPIQCLEKAAKSLYAIARRRAESSHIQDSVPPLLFSLKLYDKLDSLNGQKKDYQLPSRLFLLSSTFQSLNKIQESFFVSCLLIDYEAKKHSMELVESSEEDNLFAYLGAMSNGLLPPSTGNVPVLPQIIRSMCRQMVIDLININPSHEVSEVPHSFDDFNIGSTMGLIFEEMFGEATCIRVPFPLESIQELFGFDRVVNNETRLMHIFSLTEILVQFGKSIQQHSRDLELNETQLESALHNHSHLLRLVQEATLNIDLEYPCVFWSWLGLVASTSLVPSFGIAVNTIYPDWEKGVNQMLIEVAVQIAYDSAQNLELGWNCDYVIDWKFLFGSLRIVLRNLVVMLQWKISEPNSNDDILDECIIVAERLVEFQNTKKASDIVLRANHWTIWVATFLQNELENRGDHGRAAILTLWTLALAEKIQPNQPWFRALTMTAFRSDRDLIFMSQSLSTPSFSKHAPLGSALWIFEIEFQLCELRVIALQSLASGRNSFHTHMQKAEELRDEILACTIEKSDNLFVLFTWVLSTAYLVQTDIASAFGSYTTALRASQRCQKCCQTILRRASFGRTNLDEWMAAVATSTVLAMAAQRHVEIFSRRPKLYYRLGDHRKALSYTRSILEYLNIDPVSSLPQEGEGYSPENLKYLLEAAPQVRVFLQMNCWASNPENSMQQFSDIQSHDLVRHQSDDADQTTSAIIRSIQDVISSKSDVCDVVSFLVFIIHISKPCFR